MCNLARKGMMPHTGFRYAPKTIKILRLICLGFLGCVLPCLAHAQISPGPLAKAHQSLNGAANCTQCHMVSTRSASFRCAECHREIAAELDSHRGLHSTYPQGGPPGAACVKCHSDHNGEKFAMIHWDPTPKGFDHSKTGYVLDGKHASVTCRNCHAPQHIAANARALLKNKDLSRTYMGLSPTCTTCHEDHHQGRLGPNCLRCHNTTTWKGAKIDENTFDHSMTRFPLTGKHRTTPCEKCHKPGDDGLPVYAGIKFQYCIDCHLDPHKGEFKQDCDFCHTTSTWNKSTFTTRFDHSKTDYPLIGKHVEVACVDCHKNGDFKTKIPFSACSDCHKPDPHSGQFAKRPDGGKCESCHTVAGWSPSTFTVADHAKTEFPLVSPHTRVKCADCHIPAGKETKFKIKFALCVDCHEDEHDGQFVANPWRNRCEQCHAGDTWKTSNFTIARHQKSTFPLTGGHLAVACIDCHKPPSKEAKALYHFPHLSCTSCHEDIHHGEFADRMAKSGPGGKPLGCETCHSTKEWSDLVKFDHDSTTFPLLGSHRAVGCAECHKPPNLEHTMLHVDFSKAPKPCADCHEDPHGKQFGAKEDDCSSCHNSNKWKPSLFDHEKTAFSLKGGHQNVACGACHSLMKEIEGKQVLFYKPTPTACADCHGINIPKATETSGSLVPTKRLDSAPFSGFDGAESAVGIGKSDFQPVHSRNEHGTLRVETSISTFYLLCLDSKVRRACDFPGSQRKQSEGKVRLSRAPLSLTRRQAQSESRHDAGIAKW